MQTFTVEPTTRLAIDVPSDHGFIDATGEPGTVTVDVRPAQAHRSSDQKAAEHVMLEPSKDVLRITSTAVTFFPFGAGSGTALLRLTVPAGMEVETRTGNGEIGLTGVTGDTRLKTSNGAVSVERATSLNAATSNGSVRVALVDGQADVNSSSGEIAVGTVGGDATLRTSNGAVRIDAAGRDLSAKTSNGSITVGTCGGHTRLRTSLGGVRINRVTGGALDAATSMGEIEVLVDPDVAVWLDAQSKAGVVLNDLAPTEGPASERTAELTLSTSMGAIRVRRAAAQAAA